jgi:hypothetical protein
MNTFLPITIRYRNLTKYIVFNWIQFNICLFHYINRVRVANGRRGSSVNIVKRLQAGKLRELRHQASTRGFYLVLRLQMGTEDHIDSFTTGPADKTARAWSCQPSTTYPQDEGSAGSKSFYSTYCCCIEETECCDRILTGEMSRIALSIKIAAFCVSHVCSSDNIALCIVTVLTHSCDDYRMDRLW